MLLFSAILLAMPFLSNAQQRYVVNDRVNLYAGDYESGTFVGPPANYEPGGERTATINVTYTGFTAPAQAAFQYAVDIWESLITSSVTINIDAQFTALGPGILGSAGATTIWRDFGGAPLAGTWYPQALANSLTGSDLDPGLADIEANFSNTFGFYFGTDGNPGAGQYDFVTVVLHEIGHGLGFFGSAYVDAGLGYIEQGGFPYVYDTFVENGGGTSILSYVDGSVALAGQLQGNNLFWDGPNVDAANGGNAPLYAPATWDPGSSYSHLNESSYPAGNPSSLMTPQVGAAEAIHSPGPVGLAVLEDMGWAIDAGGCLVLGCTDPLACNYNATADCDDGSCDFGDWYIPIDWTASNTPMIQSCSFVPGYTFADQTCAQQIADADPYCINTDWDGICMDAYNDCLYGTGCNWYIPDTPSGGPAVWDCTAPANYILADQPCAQEIILDDPYCVNVTWDSICQDAYDCCTGVGAGCLDPAACNYDATAICDDGSCTYEQYYIPLDIAASNTPMVLVCAGDEPAGYILADQACAQERVDFDAFCINNDWDALCQNAYNCCLGNAPGCTIPTACNYDPDACHDFALCTFPGCTDAAACNYDAAAGCDDGSCTYPQYYIPIDVAAASTPMVFVCAGSQPAGYILADQACAADIALADPFCITNDWDGICQNAYDCCTGVSISGCTIFGACNYDPAAVCNDGSCVFPGCTDATACNYNSAAGCDDGSCTYPQYYIPNDVAAFPLPMVLACAGSEPAGYSLADQTCASDIAADDPYCVNTDWDVICQTAYDCCTGVSISGCTFSGACNYNPDAVCDDGSCTFPGCTYAAASNYNPAAGCDDGSCNFDVSGCTDPTACNYNAVASTDDGSCTFAQYYIPCNIDAPNQPMVLACSAPAGYILADQACAQARVDDDPYCINTDWDMLCQSAYNCCLGAAPGCVDSFACNYDPTSCGDFLLCEYPGCTYPDASNYNMSAGCDDGSCLFDTIGSSCPEDLNGDGFVNAGDLLTFLAAFGSVCP